MADRNGTPTRIPGFFKRQYRSEAEQDELTCPDCQFTVTLEHDECPDAGELFPCGGCGQNSRVPALPSQAGMPQAIDPPPHDERS